MHLNAQQKDCLEVKAPQPVLVFADNAGVDAAPRLPRLKKGGVILVPMSISM